MISPTSEAELCEAVSKASGPLRISGGGTRPVGKVTGEALSLSNLSGIELYEPGALTIVAKAGTPVHEIEAALAAENQRLPFEPMDHRRLLGTKGAPTIGGVVAANVSGPRRIQAGACRDSLIGVRFVDGTGRAIKNGGRVMKNVTGYDLVKLMAGAHGTLGVLSEVSFKVLPAVESSATVQLAGLPLERAVAAMSAALGSPFDVNGAAHDPLAGATSIRIEGFAPSVDYRAAELTKLLADFGAAQVLDHESTLALWSDIRDVVKFADAPGDVWKISVKPTDAPDLADKIHAEDLVLDWGGGLVWARVAEGADIRRKMAGMSGHATLVRGDAFPAFHPEPEALASLSRGLRMRFDPRGILNTGLMG